MSNNQLYLFNDKRFLPIFIVQLCGCINDSILKSALIILITYKLSTSLTVSSYTLVMLANFLFVVPFIIFASLSGQIADRYERTVIVKIVKILEILIVLCGAYGFIETNLAILFTTIALMGTHSTFFGPLKYSVLPDHLKKHELISANGYIEAATFLAILIGTMIGGFYNRYEMNILYLSLIIATTGAVTSFWMPKSNNSNDKIKINYNIFSGTYKILKYAYSRNKVYLTILGISWFWFFGAAILAQIPLLTKETLGADENVANLFLITFSIGVGVGSFLCNKIIGNKISTKYVFTAALGISIFCLDLYFATVVAQVKYHPEHLKSVYEFLSKKHYWRILIDLFFLAVLAGLYAVPLYATMQYFTPVAHRSRVIAANNLINSLFMAGSTAMLALLYLEFSIPSVILIVGLLNLIVALHIYKFIPNSRIVPIKVWKFLFRIVFKTFYKVEVKGLKNLHNAGKKIVIVANHISYIDPPLIASFVTENIQFAINMTIAKSWWVWPFTKIINTIPIEPQNPMAVKTIIDELKKDKKIAIFPEGRISLTGGLMKVYEGPALIADKSGAAILPVRIDGTEHTLFSKSRKTLRSKFQFRRKITITVLPPLQLTAPLGIGGKERRKYITNELYNLMAGMMVDSSDVDQTLFQAFINAGKLYGMEKKILEDGNSENLSYKQIITRSIIISGIIKKYSANQQHIGLMIPSGALSVISFFGIFLSGKVPAMIDFSAELSTIIDACKTAAVKTIIASKDCVGHNATDLIPLLAQAGIKIFYLEEVLSQTPIYKKLLAFAAGNMPQLYYRVNCHKTSSTDPAVVLFTRARAENKIKTVLLSHRNIQSNKNQISAVIDFNSKDTAFNAMPLYLGFSLTTTMVMLINGVKTFLYPFPQHYKIIPELIYDLGSTILLSTDSFLSAYAEHAHPYDFYSLRYVISMGDPVKLDTREIWLTKFGIRILEAYSSSETLVSMNTPMFYKAGTVGRLLPKIEYKIIPVPGLEKGGKLYLRGSNIMIGHIDSELSNAVVSVFCEELGKGWYDTGDIVEIDDEGFLTIISSRSIN